MRWSCISTAKSLNLNRLPLHVDRLEALLRDMDGFMTAGDLAQRHRIEEGLLREVLEPALELRSGYRYAVRCRVRWVGRTFPS